MQNSKQFLLLVALIIVFTVLGLALPVLLGSFIDTFDIKYYAQHLGQLLQGQIVSWEYPLLAWIPIIVAGIFGSGFMIAFICIMTACNIGTLWCVWKLGGLKAGILYATSFPIFYLSVLKLDAWPTFLMMLGIWMMTNGAILKGRGVLVLGVLAKIFPAIPLGISLLHGEKKKLLYLMAVLGVIAVISYPYLNEYFTRTFLRPIYANTLSYLTGFGQALIVVAVLLVAFSLVDARKDIITQTLILLFGIVLASPFRSPQYWVWLVPLVVILVKTRRQIFTYYIVMFLVFLEFPIFFGTVYVNNTYLVTLAPLFFLVLFAGWAILIADVIMDGNTPAHKHIYIYKSHTSSYGSNGRTHPRFREGSHQRTGPGAPK